jgi:hypothetical protein
MRVTLTGHVVRFSGHAGAECFLISSEDLSRPHDAWLRVKFLCQPKPELKDEYSISALRCVQISNAHVVSRAAGMHAQVKPDPPNSSRHSRFSSRATHNYRGSVTTIRVHVSGVEAVNKKFGRSCRMRQVKLMPPSRHFTAKRISNAFLTRTNPAERIWLIVLNYLLPLETSSLWGKGVLLM